MIVPNLGSPVSRYVEDENQPLVLTHLEQSLVDKDVPGEQRECYFITEGNFSLTQIVHCVYQTLVEITSPALYRLEEPDLSSPGA
ncbi:hypothetical protein Tco_1186459 [Tanacetum coccineum]